MVAIRSRQQIDGIKPFPIYQKQSDFLQSRAFVKGFAAGRGAGKTVIGAFEIGPELGIVDGRLAG